MLGFYWRGFSEWRIYFHDRRQDAKMMPGVVHAVQWYLDHLGWLGQKL